MKFIIITSKIQFFYLLIFWHQIRVELDEFVHCPRIVKSRQVNQKWLTAIVDDGVHVLDEGHGLIAIFYQGDGVALRTKTLLTDISFPFSDKAVWVSDPIEWGQFAWTYLSDQIMTLFWVVLTLKDHDACSRKAVSTQTGIRSQRCS
jgi:hypothetical protein